MNKEGNPTKTNETESREMDAQTEQTSIRRAVVNGPLGTVGMATVNNLLSRGIETLAVCFPGDPRIANLPSGAKVIELDMREIRRLPEIAGGGADAFFHLAWMGTIGPGRNDAAVQTENIRCAVEAARTAKELGCAVFIGVGSQAEHGRIEGLVRPDSPCCPNTGYGIAKLCAGQMTRLLCRQLGMRHVWARILSAYGPGDGPLSVIPTLLGRLLKKEKPALTRGEQLWDFCYSGDAAEALYRLRKGRGGLPRRQRTGPPPAGIFRNCPGRGGSLAPAGSWRNSLPGEPGDAPAGRPLRPGAGHGIPAPGFL